MSILAKLPKIQPLANLKEFVRFASKKTGGSTRIAPGHPRPKHRGWKVWDGTWVPAGKILVLQRTLRFHPGLNVGFGSNGTLFAIVPGIVRVTCEMPDLNWNHTWVEKNYAGRAPGFYKKYFNILPETQHKNFKLIEEI